MGMKKPQGQWLGFFGGAEGNRTPDLCIANAALSQLSYSPSKRDEGALTIASKKRVASQTHKKKRELSARVKSALKGATKDALGGPEKNRVVRSEERRVGKEGRW